MSRRLVRNAVATVGCCIILLGAYVWTEARKYQVAVRQGVCQHHLAFIYRAFWNYHNKYHRFPPAYIADKDGKPMHSWRVLVLETLHEPFSTEVYNAYRFDEPWDGPNNRKLADKMPSFYGCMNASDPISKSLANYAVITGPGAVFRGGGAPAAAMSELEDRDTGYDPVAKYRVNPPFSYSEYGDFRRGTIVLAETTPGIPWMEPRDLELDRMSLRLNDPARPSISSKDPSGPGVVLLNGRIERLQPSLTPAELNALILAHPAAGQQAGEPKKE